MRHVGRRKSFDVEEDRATYVRWRRGVIVFYGVIALIAFFVFLASRLFGN